MPDAIALAAAAPAAVPVRRRPRLADLPAAPLLALVPLVPPIRPFVVLRQIAEGRVLAEAGGGAVVAVLEVAGELTRELFLPRAGLMTLAKRHPRADRLTVDGPDPDGAPLLLLRALDRDSSATVICPEADPMGGSVAALLQAVPLLALGDEQVAMVDPQLLRQGIEVLQRIGGRSPIDLAMPAHDTLAAVLRARLQPGGDLLRAVVAVARMVERDGG